MDGRPAWIALAGALIIGLAVALGGASVLGPADVVGEISVGDPVAESNSFAPGTEIWAGPGAFAREENPAVELVSITPLGMPDVTFETYLVYSEGIGALGLFPAEAVPDEFRAAARPLAHASLGPDDGWAQAIVIFRLPADGVTIRGYRLRYRLDGAERTVFIPYSDHVCPTGSGDCDLVSPHP